MKIMTVLGTRPEIIRLSLVIRLLDRYAEHVLVHTGQNSDPRLSEVFFRELEVRAPDVQLSLANDHFGAQVGSLFAQMEPVFRQHRPDRLLILGDTTSGLATIVARRLGIPVYHMEAGNRCFDDRVPEEVNRRVIDHCSTVLLPYTHRSKENLRAEGIPAERIFVTGNPIGEVIEYYRPQIDKSSILSKLGVGPKQFFLVTLHRAENVASAHRLRSFWAALEALHGEYHYPVICSLHPRTRAQMRGFGIDSATIQCSEPFGFFDFVRLEGNAFCVLSDSGTVQEECALLGAPNVTLRDTTERPETLEAGSNVLSGAEAERVSTLVRLVTQQPIRWTVPAEYQVRNVADTVVRLLLSQRLPDPAETAWQERKAQ